MKKLIPLMIGIIITLTGCNVTPIENLQVGKEEIPKQNEESYQNFAAIPVQDFLNFFDSDEYIMLDVRTPEEIAEGKINKGALEIDYYDEDFKEQLGRLDKTKKYLVYCRSGRRSGETMKIMEELGFAEAYDLLGGILAFNEMK